MNMPDIDFTSLDIREIGLWPLILRIAVICGACLATFVAMYIFILSDQFKALDTQEGLEQAKRTDFKTKYNLASNLEAYQKQIIEVKDSYRKILQEIPASDQIPELIDQISREAANNGLKNQSIKPGKPDSILGFYKQLPIELKLTGTYNGFGGFVSDVSKLTRIITFSDFVISSDSSGKGVIPGELSMTITANAYWLSSESETSDKTKGASKSTDANKAPNTRGATPGTGPAGSGQATPGMPRGSRAPQ